MRRCRCPTQARTTGYPTARSYVEPTEWDPVRISPQRTVNGPTQETRTRVDSTGHRAAIVTPPISRGLRSIVRKRGSSSPPRTAGDPTTRWQRSRPIGCSRWGDGDMFRRGTPLLHQHRVVVRRVAMSLRERCVRKTNRNIPSNTVGTRRFASHRAALGLSLIHI